MKKLILLLLLAVSTIASAQVVTIKHTAYEIRFDTQIKEPLWTYYVLTKEHANHLATDKRMAFHSDSLVCLKCQATDYDFKGFNKIYDKGHLSPYKDFTWSKRTEKESMVLTNQAPQVSAFNEVLWRMLENYVRTVATKEDVKVYTGVIYGTRKAGTLLVPDYYWKLIQHSNGTYEGWKIPNQIPTTKDFNVYKIDTNELLKLIR